MSIINSGMDRELGMAAIFRGLRQQQENQDGKTPGEFDAFVGQVRSAIRGHDLVVVTGEGKYSAARLAAEQEGFKMERLDERSTQVVGLSGELEPGRKSLLLVEPPVYGGRSSSAVTCYALMDADTQTAATAPVESPGNEKSSTWRKAINSGVWALTGSLLGAATFLLAGDELFPGPDALALISFAPIGGIIGAVLSSVAGWRMAGP